MLMSFSISGFRDMPETHIDISKMTAIIGANGSGKTHLLEGVHLVSGGTLHYFHSGRDDVSDFEVRYEEAIGPKSYRIERRDARDIYSIQWAKVSGVKYREALPYRTVFLSPFDMNLLYFAPSMRRDYLDSILARTYAQFPKVRRDYETVMRQRNALLKKIRDGEVEREHLDFWDQSFAEKTEIYTLYRRKWYDFIRETRGPIEALLPKYDITFSYESKVWGDDDVVSVVRQYLRENRERDILTGHTHIWPHLEDFSFFIQKNNIDIEAQMMLSRGETKMLLLALKQLEILFLKKSLDLPIILLFDDLFAELDLPHVERVISLFDADQVVVTTQRPLPKWEKWDDFACINLSPV